MDDTSLQQLSDDIEALKKSVRRNDPLLREIAAPPGWTLFSLMAAVSVSAFALPAHILSVQYGSFAAIPAVWKAGLWAVLALFFVLGGSMKAAIMTRRTRALGGGLSALAKAFYGGQSAHIVFPLSFLAIASVVAAVLAARPWLGLPVATALWGVLANHIGVRSGNPAYLVVGYWSIGLSLPAWFFVERSPFLWLFILWGGMFFAFAGALSAVSHAHRGRHHGEPGEG